MSSCAEHMQLTGFHLGGGGGTRPPLGSQLPPLENLYQPSFIIVGPPLNYVPLTLNYAYIYSPPEKVSTVNILHDLHIYS